MEYVVYCFTTPGNVESERKAFADAAENTDNKEKVKGWGGYWSQYPYI